VAVLQVAPGRGFRRHCLSFMIRFCRTLQVTLTNGVNGANQVVIANQIHALGFSTTPTGFCVGSPTSSAYGCIDQSVPDAELNSYGAGTGTDGTPFKYELLFARQMNDTWCLMDDASSAINVTGQVRWLWTGSVARKSPQNRRCVLVFCCRA
jgi:hypothetical protein